MTDRRLVYLSGEPGVGKSTLMAHLTAGWTRYPQPSDPGAPARDLLVAPRHGPVGVELGRRRDAFAGTDALPSAAVVVACAYLRSDRSVSEASPLLLAEGARLANRRFLSCAVDQGWRVTLVHLFGTSTAAWRRRERAAALGKREQNEAWVRGRATAARNLANGAEAWGCEVRAIDVGAADAEHALDDLVREVRGWVGA